MVLFIESVVIACSTNFRFKCDVCQLALDSVCMETKIKVGSLRTYGEASYKGAKYSVDVNVIFTIVSFSSSFLHSVNDISRGARG